MTSGAEERFDLTWRVTPDLLGVLGPSGYFEATNPAWFATLGYTPKEIESCRFFDFVHPDDVPRTERAFAEIQKGNPVLQFENRYRHKDGSYRWLSWNCVPERDKFYCSGRDVTESKQNAAALKTRDEEAGLREQFIAVLGHDLRNPLTAIQSGITMLERGDADGERRQIIVDESKRSIGRMFALIDDLMDFARSRLGSGLSLNLADEPDLDTAIGGTVREVQIGNPTARITTEQRIDRPVRCDVGRVRQLVSNLLANAVTHGEEGGEIILRSVVNAADIAISVTNYGPVIPDHVLRHLFEPFVREQARPSQEGLGLGLFISAQIARAHGGALVVESVDDRTTFTFTLPQ